MSEQGYQGWKNYPTWAVNLWLSNDEGLYRATLDTVEDVRGMDHPSSQYWKVSESVRFNLAARLRDWVTDDLSPDLGASFVTDIYGWALEQVDWDEIAQAWLDA